MLITRKVRVIAVLSIAALALGACQKPEPRAAAAAKPAAPIIPAAVQTALWRIEVVTDGKSGNPVDVCADPSVARGFTHPAPEIRGQACERVGKAFETSDAYTVRCRVDHEIYQVSSKTSGDRASDFTVQMTVNRQDGRGPAYEQVRRYHRISACPADWKVGDSAAPGSTQVVNTLTGEKRSASKGG